MPGDIDDKSKEDILLWNQFREGDENAFARLYDIFSDMLYRYGMKFMENEDSVKDCIQELFIKLYSNRQSLSATDNPRLYLFKALKNRLIDEIRADKHLVYVSPQDLHFSVEYYYDPEEESQEDSDVKVQFEKVISLLTDRQKEVIYLRYQMEMSYEDIAELLNINYQSVRNLIHRAIEKVRSEMDWKFFLLLLLNCAK